NYLKGYAAVCQLKKDYQKAFDMYHICLMLSPDNDFSLVYYMGQCQMGLKNTKMATELFNTVVTYSQNEKVKEMATAYLELLTANTEEEVQTE
ncbi:TPA: tetratricopeptide repeat protein, partial [Escherichia coli]|nr:tetratricopeptide repeat protein [Escherichia coli]